MNNGKDGISLDAGKVELLIYLDIHFAYYGNIITPDDVKAEWDLFNSCATWEDTLMALVQYHVDILITSFKSTL